MRAQHRLAEEFDVDLPLRIFFEATTVAALAVAVETELAAQIAGLTDAEVENLLAGEAAVTHDTTHDRSAAMRRELLERRLAGARGRGGRPAADRSGPLPSRPASGGCGSWTGWTRAARRTSCRSC
nr:hypothetical protein GCM10020093_034120 [Planobispora longispora]